jgi:hypothetical protein
MGNRGLEIMNRGKTRARARVLVSAVLATLATLTTLVFVPGPNAIAQSIAAPTSHSGNPTPDQPAAAVSFTPGFIIADENFYSHDAMSEAQIQAFLDARVGTCLSADCLNVLRVAMPSYPAAFSTSTGALLCSSVTGGSALRASTIIYRVQQACGISARVILVTLQKEQGLVTSKDPSAYALSYAMGWACPDSTGCVDPNSQFGYQVYRGARQLVTYKLANFARQPGVHQIAYSPSPSCGSTSVRIVNYATAALYNYTPYQPTAASIAAWPGAVSPYSPCNSYGNRNFWFYYNQWFGNPTAVVPGPTAAPEVTVNDGATLQLTWTPPAEDGTSAVTGYYVEYKRASATTWSRVAGGPVPETQFTFVGPTLGMEFEFRVRAVNRFGTGAPSAVVTATTPSAPSVPESLAVTVNDGAQLRLEWAAPASSGSSAVSDYVIQYKRSTSSTWITVADGVSASTSFTFVRPSAGVTFDFRVQARNSFGAGPFTAALRATTPGPLPSAPQSLAVTVNDGAQLRLEWAAPASSGSSAVSDYVIQYKRSTSSTWITVADGVSASTSFTFVRPSAGVTFDFRVQARNSAGVGPFTSAVRATTPSS